VQKIAYLVPASIGVQVPGLSVIIEQAVRNSGRIPVALSWPPRLDGRFLAEVRRCAWVIVECCLAETGLAVSYLRGLAIPMLRTRFQGPDSADNAILDEWDRVIFGELHEHYDRSLIYWSDLGALAKELGAQTELMDRLQALAPVLVRGKGNLQPVPPPPTKREEAVFLSYASADREFAATVAAALRNRFSNVFDYKESGSIPLGSCWFEFVMSELNASSVGVPLVSQNYQQSEYCTAEAMRMRQAQVERQMLVFPLELDGSRNEAFRMFQAVRVGGISVTRFVENIVRALDRSTA
jgi:hypothetical protein